MYVALCNSEYFNYSHSITIKVYRNVKWQTHNSPQFRVPYDRYHILNNVVLETQT